MKTTAGFFRGQSNFCWMFTRVIRQRIQLLSEKLRIWIFVNFFFVACSFNTSCVETDRAASEGELSCILKQPHSSSSTALSSRVRASLLAAHQWLEKKFILNMQTCILELERVIEIRTDRDTWKHRRQKYRRESIKASENNTAYIKF